MKINKVFSQVLRECRNQKGLSQEKLAERSDLERNFISLLETNKRQPSLTTIFKLAKGLEMSATHLISLVEEKEKEH